MFLRVCLIYSLIHICEESQWRISDESIALVSFSLSALSRPVFPFSIPLRFNFCLLATRTANTRRRTPAYLFGLLTPSCFFLFTMARKHPSVISSPRLFHLFSIPAPVSFSSFPPPARSSCEIPSLELSRVSTHEETM